MRDATFLDDITTKKYNFILTFKPPVILIFETTFNLFFIWVAKRWVTYVSKISLF